MVKHNILLISLTLVCCYNGPRLVNW